MPPCFGSVKHALLLIFCKHSIEFFNKMSEVNNKYWAKIKMPKFLLCRPQGGLNDVLCQIVKCCEYAKKYERVVFVDTEYERSYSYWDSFSNYFVSRAKPLLLDGRPKLKSLEVMSIFPPFLKDRLTTYDVVYKGKSLFDTSCPEGQPISFNFGKSYHEDLLVHHQFGGGQRSLRASKYMRVQDHIVTMLAARLKSIEGPFEAIHIRHTDMESDYERALESLRSKKISKLFVATDNKSVLEQFRQAMGSDVVLSFSMLPDAAGRTLHHHRYERETQRQVNTEAILDLFTLSYAQTLTICKSTNNPHLDYSGFSLLAKALHKNQTLRDSFLAGPDQI
jgi:hypothetical protein